MTGRSDARVTLALLGAIVSISFAAPLIRLAAPTHPLIIAGARLALAALALAPFLFRGLRAGRVDLRVLRTGALAGLLYGVHFGTWVWSLTLTSVASSVTLVTATPLLLAAISIGRGRDRPERRHWLAMGLAFVGLLAIGYADLGAGALEGDALALLGAVAMAFYLLLVRGLGERLDVLAFGAVACAVGALVLGLSAVLVGVPIEVASGESLAYIALAALVPQLVGHTLLTWSLRHATPTAVGIATVGEPVGATALAFVILGEGVGPLVLVGCAITLAAVTLSLRRPTPDEI